MKRKPLADLPYFFSTLVLVYFIFIIPYAIGANPNLFVSAENSQFDNYMSGPQVIEVVVIDSDINDTDEAKREPDVTVNGNILRMVQAVDGNWYGYFADRDQVLIADSTTSVEGQGLDYGVICGTAIDLGNAADGTHVDVSDTSGVALPDIDDVRGGLNNGAEFGGPITVSVTKTGDGDNARQSMNTVRKAKPMNMEFPPGEKTGGQIGLDPDFWPFIQLYELNPTGNVVVQYNKGGGLQTTTLTFDTVEQFSGTEHDRAKYPRGAEVHITITDPWLNIDPTDVDSWTFGTFRTLSTNYQVFDKRGNPAGDAAIGGAIDISTRLSDLMCEDNCVLVTSPDTQGRGNVFTLQDNKISSLIPSVAGDPQDPRDWQTQSGISHLAGSIPVTLVENGPKSGIFTSSDESGVSTIKITENAPRGNSATIDYNEEPVSILVGFDFATINIMPPVDDWNSGEEITVILTDSDANKNTRISEALTVYDPYVTNIPTIRIGNPFTLSSLSSATFAGADLVIDEIQPISDRVMLRNGPVDRIVPESSSLVLTLDQTFAKLFESIHDPEVGFTGTNFFHYDIRSIVRSLVGGAIRSADIDVTDGERTTRVGSGISAFSIDPLNLDHTQGESIFSMNGSAPVQIVITFHIEGSPLLPANSVIPVVADFFSIGILSDEGGSVGQAVNNMVVRLELEETGRRTSQFNGSLEFRMLNPLNFRDLETLKTLRLIANNAIFFVSESLKDENALRIEYCDLGADGVITQVADQEEILSHTGIVSFDKDGYRQGDTVVVTLEDRDLNLDSNLIDIYTVVSPSQFPSDPAKDTIGKAGLGDVGRLLEITLNGVRWTSGMTENGGNCGEAGFPVDGLAATGFTLVETRADTGVFVGSFRFPDTYCDSSTGEIRTTIGADIQAVYIDYADVASLTTEVRDVARNQTHTGSITLDRTVYPMPFGSVNDFFPGEAQADAVTPNGDSLFPVHQTGVTADGDEAIDATTEEIGPGVLIVHIQVTDPDFIHSQSKDNTIAFGDHGPVTVSIVRGTETLVLATAGGSAPNSGVITSGHEFVPGATRELGPIPEVDGENGIFAFDLPVRYTDGPASEGCPLTADHGYATLSGEVGILGRFDQIPGAGDYCILQGDIIQVTYDDPADQSGERNRFTDSGTFDLRNGVLKSDKSIYILERDLILTMIEPDLNLDSDRKETYTLDLIEWQSDAAKVTVGELGGELGAFNPNPATLRETGDGTGIFQTTIEIPELLKGNHLDPGEKIQLQYMDWGPSGADFVGQESERINATIFISNLGASVGMDRSVYSWADKVFITVVAPDWNRNFDVVEVIGSTDLNPVTISTRDFQLDKYILVETGMNTGIFTGEVILTGFFHDADGDPQTGDEFGFDTRPRTLPSTGGGPTNGFIQADQDDAITISFEFPLGEKVVTSALVRWNLGEIQWLESNYPVDGIGIVRVIDPDMNLNPEVVDSFNLTIGSTTDPPGIRVSARETNEATGIFEAEIQFTSTEESYASILRVTSGDEVTARYEDHTLPVPRPPSDHQELIATTRTGPGPADPLPLQINNPRVEDASRNPVDNVSVDQHTGIAIDVRNPQDRDQAFVYFVQVRNEQTLVEALGWITGSIPPRQSFSPTIFWTPTSPGRFEATLFFWESIDNPMPLTEPQILSIQVN